MLLEEYNNCLQNFDTQKIIIEINFISSKDAEEEHLIHSPSNNIKFTLYSHVNEVTDELFESLHSRNKENSKTLMRGSDFIFDSVQRTVVRIVILQIGLKRKKQQ